MKSKLVYLDAEWRMYQCVADMEAMKTENEQRLSNGESMAYGEEHFFAIVDELQEIRDDVLAHVVKKGKKHV